MNPLGLPWRPQVYDKHVGLVDRHGFSVASLVDRGGIWATILFARTACRWINRTTALLLALVVLLPLLAIGARRSASAHVHVWEPVIEKTLLVPRGKRITYFRRCLYCPEKRVGYDLTVNEKGLVCAFGFWIDKLEPGEKLTVAMAGPLYKMDEEAWHRAYKDWR